MESKNLTDQMQTLIRHYHEAETAEYSNLLGEMRTLEKKNEALTEGMRILEEKNEALRRLLKGEPRR